MGGSHNTRVGIGPAFRYYFDLEKIKPFAGLGLSYNIESLSGLKDDLTSTEVKLTAGLDIFVTNYLALETSINCSFINSEYPTGYYFGTSNNSTLFQMSVGFNYFIY